MKHKLFFLPVLIFMLVLGLLWKGLSTNPHHLQSILINKSLPDFSVSSLLHPNHRVTAGDFRHRVTLLNIFASWCTYCHIEHPLLVRMRNDYDIPIYGLNYKDKRQAAIDWLQRYNNPYVDVMYDPKGETAINLGVYGVPETFLIDRMGVVRYRYVGTITEKVWRDVLWPKIQAMRQR